jgi:hypothetical protein
MADEDTVLDEAMDNLKEPGQRIRATQRLMRSQGMTDGEDYRDLLTRLSTVLAMTEAAYLQRFAIILTHANHRSTNAYTAIARKYCTLQQGCGSTTLQPAVEARRRRDL